jgi:hypothetical protein
MTIETLIPLLALPAFWAFAEWRLGLILCLATAVMQDPLRKITVDRPVLFVGLVAVVFMAACLGATVRGISLNPSNIFRRYPRLVSPFMLLLLLIIVQAFNSYLRFNNPTLTFIGVLTYILPLFSMAFVYQLVRRQGEFCIRQFMKSYIVWMALVLTTVYLEYSGYDWPILGQVGGQLIIYSETGQILPAFSGSFRSPEIAAWHAMAAVCFILIVNFSRGVSFRRALFAAIVAVLLLGLGMLTGRRKIAVELAVFIGTYFILWVIFERGVGKLAIIAMTGAALIGYAWLVMEVRDGDNTQNTLSSEFSRYVEHTENAFQEVPTRFVDLGIAPVMWAYDAFGLFGAGLGAGTQGTQYFGGGWGLSWATGAAEGGLGKITLELGIPGLFVIGWIAIWIFRYLWRIMRFASRYSQRMGRISFGLVSFLLANAAGFSVATQAYGDLFILLILSWITSFLLAIPILIEREVHARQLATLEGTSPVFRPRPV